MIIKHRNQAILRITAGLITFLVGLAVLAFTEHSAQTRLGQALAIILMIVGYLSYVFGCTAWAEAKGYSSSLAIGLVALGLLCFLLSSLLLPPVVLFALEDKTRGHRDHSRRSKWRRWFK